MVSYIRGRGLRTLSDREIVSLYLSGEDSMSIGARANCASETVLYLVRRAGGTVRPRGPHKRVKVLPLDDDMIVKLYRDGLSGPVIADRCGTTPATIYAILRSHHVPRRSPGNVSAAMAAAAKARARKPMP